MTLSLEWKQPGIAILKVQRPRVRNALNFKAMNQFAMHVEKLHQNPDLRVLILTGSDGAFISGGDLKELSAYPSAADGLRVSQIMSKALNRLEALPCPTVSAINGPARGGGAEISLACDLRIIDPQASIGFVQVKLGLTTGWGGGQRLMRLVGYSRALEWLLTGRVLTAEEAYRFGLANQVSPAGKCLEKSLALASKIAEAPLHTVYAIKRMLRIGASMSPAFAQSFEQSQFPGLWSHQNHLEAVRKFLDGN